MTTKSQGPAQPPLEAQPILGQRGKVIQPFGTMIDYPIGLERDVREANADALNQILVDTLSLRDLYKKHHWQVTGPTFTMLHELFERHFKEQVEIIDMIGERIQTLGSLALVLARDVAARTRVEQPPPCREQVPVQISRLIEAHTLIIDEARAAVRLSAKNGDDETNNLLVSFVLPRNEKQIWFLATHLVDTPLVRAHR